MSASAAFRRASCTNADRFTALRDLGHQALRRGEAEEAAARYDEALRLWRGPALVDVPSDVLRRAEKAEVTCVLKEEADGTMRVSLRSLGAVDVRRVAEAHGGGGHRFAAGFTSDLDLDTLVARIRAAL